MEAGTSDTSDSTDASHLSFKSTLTPFIRRILLDSMNQSDESEEGRLGETERISSKTEDIQQHRHLKAMRLIFRRVLKDSKTQKLSLKIYEDLKNKKKVTNNALTDYITRIIHKIVSEGDFGWTKVVEVVQAMLSVIKALTHSIYTVNQLLHVIDEGLLKYKMRGTTIIDDWILSVAGWDSVIEKVELQSSSSSSSSLTSLSSSSSSCEIEVVKDRSGKILGEFRRKRSAMLSHTEDNKQIPPEAVDRRIERGQLSISDYDYYIKDFPAPLKIVIGRKPKIQQSRVKKSSMKSLPRYEDSPYFNRNYIAEVSDLKVTIMEPKDPQLQSSSTSFRTLNQGKKCANCGYYIQIGLSQRVQCKCGHFSCTAIKCSKSSRNYKKVWHKHKPTDFYEFNPAIQCFCGQPKSRDDSSNFIKCSTMYCPFSYCNLDKNCGFNCYLEKTFGTHQRDHHK